MIDVISTYYYYIIIIIIIIFFFLEERILLLLQHCYNHARGILQHLHAPSQHNKKKLIHAHSHLVNLGTQDQQGLLEYLHSLLIRVEETFTHKAKE